MQAQLKSDSRKALRGHYGVAGLPAILPLLLSALVAGLEWFTARLLGISYWTDPADTPQYFFDDRLRLTLMPLLLFVGFGLLQLLLTAPIRLGGRQWYLKLVAGNCLPVRSALGEYRTLRRLLRAAWLLLNLKLRQAALWLVVTLPALLSWVVYCTADRLFPTAPWVQPLLFAIFLVLLGTCQVLWFYHKQRYFLTEYLYLLYPCKLRDAFKMSALVMKKQKHTVFSLKLSCLSLALLSLLLLPMWYTLPQIYAAQAACAKALLEEYEATKLKACTQPPQKTIPLPKPKRIQR